MRRKLIALITAMVLLMSVIPAVSAPVRSNVKEKVFHSPVSDKGFSI